MPTTSSPDLLAGWLAALPGADPGRAAVAGADLLARWDEPHRRYHTREHLAEVLRVIDEHAVCAADPGAVRLAAWYHDAVYDPNRDDNEERSAVLAAATLPRLDAAPACVREVERLVRLTAGHDPQPGDRNGALLCDADLAILAAAPVRYARYAGAIRQEYAHLPEDVFRPGRAAVLRGLLAVPVLYRAVPTRRAWEAAARANLVAELTGLAGAGSGPGRPRGGAGGGADRRR